MISPQILNLFWDVDICSLDIEKHKKTIIFRILNYGSLAGWRWLAHTYGKEAIVQTIDSGSRTSIREPARRLAAVMFS